MHLVFKAQACTACHEGKETSETLAVVEGECSCGLMRQLRQPPVERARGICG
jgi:hypothetical protein